MFQETRRVRSVSGTVFFPIRTFSVARKILSPDTSLKRGVSRPGNCLIHPDLLRLTAHRLLAQPVKLIFLSSRVIVFWPKLRESGIRNSTVRDVLISDISWYVKCHLRFPFRIFHGTWCHLSSTFGYSMVREVSLEIPRSDIPWYVKCHSRFPSRIFHGA